MTISAGAVAAVEHRVFERFPFTTARLPEELERGAQKRFDEFWNLHPARFHEITQPFTGKSIPLPRWQQAYGQDYRYTGSVNRALPVPQILEPYFAWVRIPTKAATRSDAWRPPIPIDGDQGAAGA